MLQPVAVGTKTLADYTHIVGRPLVEEIRELAEPLKGRRIVHVSATAFGGGVSEILYTLVPLMRDVGLEVEWQVIYGREEFFNATKLLHNALQGAPQDLSAEDWDVWERYNEMNARELPNGWDVAIIHDPQPAALYSLAPEKAGAWVWRCHIDLSTPNPETLAVGAQQQFTAVGRDGAGNVIPITPTWSTTNPPGTINAVSGLFTAGNTAGTFANSVRATEGSIFGTATVVVTAAAAAPLATITVTPNPRTLETGDQATFTAVGRDANGVVVPINPTWSVTNGGGTVPAGSTGQTVVFTAGNTTGTFTNTVRATQGAIFGRATVIVTAPPVTPPPPAPASSFRVLARTAVACTSGSISGDVGTFQAAPTGSFTPVNCPVNGGTAQVGTPAAVQAYNSFVAAYNQRETVPCGTVLTGTLAGVTLPPGVYCFENAATLTGTLTLNGPSTGTWLFKVGTSGVGALTTTGFTVVMGGGASSCNVTWWVEDAATMTDSNMRGAILAGGDLTATRGTLQGNAWSQGDVTITGTVLSACTP